MKLCWHQYYYFPGALYRSPACSDWMVLGPADVAQSAETRRGPAAPGYYAQRSARLTAELSPTMVLALTSLGSQSSVAGAFRGRLVNSLGGMATPSANT